jgi:S-adenosylmethionine hydrolase
MDYMQDEMDIEEISSNIIPELEGYHIGHIDGHGNIKTTITHEYFKEKYRYGDEIRVKINGVEQRVKYVSNLFGGTKDELVIYPGSSGPKDNRYLEITKWSHFTGKDIFTGSHAFNNPTPGQQIIIL